MLVVGCFGQELGDSAAGGNALVVAVGIKVAAVSVQAVHLVALFLGSVVSFQLYWYMWPMTPE